MCVSYKLRNFVEEYLYCSKIHVGVKTRIATNQQLFLPLSKVRFSLKVHFSHVSMNQLLISLRKRTLIRLTSM